MENKYPHTIHLLVDSFIDAILNDYKEGHLSHKQTKYALS